MTLSRQARFVGVLVGLVAWLGVECAVHAEPHKDAGAKRSWLAPVRGKKPVPVAAGAGLGFGRSALGVSLVAALGAAALLVRRRQKNAGAQPSAALKVIATTALGGRARLVLADVGGRRVLLGVTERSVRRLAWLDRLEAAEARSEWERAVLEAPEPQRAERLRPAAVAAVPVAVPGVGRSFRELLKSAVGLGAPPLDTSAALQIAEATDDLYTRSEERRSMHRPEPVRMLDVEGQAKGLLARLKERGA